MDELILVKKRLNLFEKRKHHTTLKSNDKDIIELLTQCQHNNITTVKVSTTILLHAAQRNWIDLNSFIPELQLAISIASHSHLLILLLCDLMRLSSSFQTGLLKGHPLISIVTNKSSSIQYCITASINLLKKLPDVQSLNVTKPFFKYLLLHPSSPNLHLADNLHYQLLQLAIEQPLLSSDILNMILKFFSFYQCHPLENMLSSTNRICSLCKTVIAVMKESNNVSLVDQLIHCCLSTCVENTKQHLPLLELLPILKELLCLKQLSLSGCLCVSWLLMTHLTDPTSLMSLLAIVKETLSYATSHSLDLFKLPLVLIISQSSSVMSKAIKRIANHLLISIEQSDNKRMVGNNDVMFISTFSSHYTLLCILATDYINYMVGNTPNYLEFIVISGNYNDIVSLGIILCAVNPVITTVISLYPIILQEGPSMGSAMLTYTIYSLVNISDQQTRFSLLESLPSFCSNAIATELVTSTLLTFTKQLDLLPTAIRLLAKSWEKDDSVFIHLRGLLLPPASGPCRIDWSLASAATIKDICSIRPELHGEECLPYISQLLSYSQHPLMISLLVTALTNLCVNSLIEPAILWKILGPKMTSHNNPGIDKALCVFFTLAADFEDPKEADKMFCEEALQYLWKLTIRTDTETVENALKSIINFSLDSHTYSVLPPSLVSILNPSSDDSHLNAAHLLLLFLAVTKPMKDSYCLSILVECLVKEETEGIPHGVVYDAMQKLTSSGVPGRTRKELEQFLEDSRSLSEAPSVLYLLPGHIKEVQSAVKQREQLLQVIKNTLEYGIHDDLWVFSEGLSWRVFMNNMIEIYIKSTGSNLPEQGEKRELIVYKTIDEILCRLKELVRHSVFRGMGAIVGVVCSELSLEVSPKLLISLVECLTVLLKTGSLPRQPGHLCETLKILLAVARTDDCLKSVLLYIPVLTYSLSKNSWRGFQLNMQLIELGFSIIEVIQRNSDPTIIQIACFAISYFIHDLPYCKQVASCLSDSQIKIHTNKTPLLMVAGLIKGGQCTSVIITKLVSFIQSKPTSIEDIKLISLSIAAGLPLLVSTGEMCLEEAMECVQVLAELATTHSKLSELHWCLGVLVHDLYTVGTGVNLGGLMETLAVRWIQDGLTFLNSSEDIVKIQSPLLGIAGLLGLSMLSYRLCGCSNDKFVYSLISTSLPFLYQCCTVADGSVRNTGLWIITHIHSNILQERDLVPSDYNYLPDGSSLTILFTELELYCIHSRALVTATQATAILTGLSKVTISLPPTRWDTILLAMMSACQESIIKFVVNQASSNIAGLKNVINFIVHPTILQSLKEVSKRELLAGINSLTSVLSPSQLFETLLTLSSEHLVCSQSILSLLSSGNCSRQYKLLLSPVLQLLCQQLEKAFDDEEIFQPTSTFFLTLSQCLRLTDVPILDNMKNIINCSSIVAGDNHLSSLVPVLFNYLTSSLLSPLQEKWLFYTLKHFCSVCCKESSYWQTLLLTNLQDWTKENCHATSDQLTRLLLIVIAILGAKSTDNLHQIAWPLHILQDGVKQKLCEVAVFWLVYDYEPFYSAIQGLLCDLRHTSQFNMTPIWTTVVHFL